MTPASRRLHVEVGRSLDQLERDLDRFSRSQDQDRSLRIGAVAGFGRYRLAPLLFAAAGEVQVDLTGAHDDIVAALLADRIDAGVTYKPVVATPIECEELAAEEIVLVAKAGTPPITGSLATLQSLSFVTYDEYEYVFATWFRETFGKQPLHLSRSDHVSELEEALESVALAAASPSHRRTHGRTAPGAPAAAPPWRPRPPFEIRCSSCRYRTKGSRPPLSIRSLFA